MKWTLLFSFCFFIGSQLFGQVASDNADNYSVSTWFSTANQGTGFGNWDMWIQNTNASNFAGHFLGSSTPSHGDINTNGTAFGMYGNPTGNFAQANAQRGFNYTYNTNTYTTLQDGHTFSIDLAVAYRNGYKGIDLFESDFTQAFNFNVQNDEYQVNGTNLGWTYDQFSVVNLEVTQIDATTIYVKLTRGTDVYGPTQFTVTNRIGYFKCYVGNTTNGNTENNLYFNNLAIRTTDPLPVELAFFKAIQNKNTIDLHWQTLSELNNRGFEIQKSTDGKTFENIAFVEGGGNSLATIDYYFNDENPNIGLNYYRLKQMDFDGFFEFSDVVVIDFKKESSFVIYPNPTTEKLTVQTDFQGLVDIRIYNLMGQMVYQNTQRMTQQMDINLNDLTSGNYHLVIANSETEAIIYSGKIIKQ